MKPQRSQVVPLAILVFAFAGLQAFAQEGRLHADFRREAEHVKEDCGSFSFKAVGSCAYELFTDHPLHIAVGSIAPQNGFGFGAAFVSHKTPSESWRLSWNVDAIGATSGSWRAGGYMKIIHTPVAKISVVPGNTSKHQDSRSLVHPNTVFNLYAQTISLEKLLFFGLGPSAVQTGRSVFGMRETIVGTNVVKPVTEWSAISRLNLSLLGEVNGRFVNLRGNHGQSTPSIEQLYTEATAPGLASQPAFVQLSEGFRVKPALLSGRVQLNYLVNFQQFFAPSNARYSFRRWTTDLRHEFPLYRNSQSSGPRDTNGPDECVSTVGAQRCPAISRDRHGTVAFRFFLSESATSAGNVVPFYFQPTLGGSDINGAPYLSSFQDYRFRAPNLLLLRENIEHSIWGPIGATFIADQGKVALTRGDIDFGDLQRTFAAGLTLRAGGFPEVFLLFAWGGGEGHHVIGSMNTTLLGGSARPSLF